MYRGREVHAMEGREVREWHWWPEERFLLRKLARMKKNDGTQWTPPLLRLNLFLSSTERKPPTLICFFNLGLAHSAPKPITLKSCLTKHFYYTLTFFFIYYINFFFPFQNHLNGQIYYFTFFKYSQKIIKTLFIYLIPLTWKHC